MPDTLEQLARAFIAGALWMELETRIVNDGDGHVDVIPPESDELQLAAQEYAKRHK